MLGRELTQKNNNFLSSFNHIPSTQNPHTCCVDNTEYRLLPSLYQVPSRGAEFMCWCAYGIAGPRGTHMFHIDSRQCQTVLGYPVLIFCYKFYFKILNVFTFRLRITMY